MFNLFFGDNLFCKSFETDLSFSRPSLIDEASSNYVVQENSKSGRDSLDRNDDNIHEELAKIDPEMASQLHPNDVRKIKRSLELYNSYGMKHSELISAQKKQRLESRAKHDALILWLTCVTILFCFFASLVFSWIRKSYRRKKFIIKGFETG